MLDSVFPVRDTQFLSAQLNSSPRFRGPSLAPPRVPRVSDLTLLAVLTTLRAVEIQLTPRQKAFVRQAIESGRLRHEEDAVREALALWEQRECARVELLVAFDETEADLEAGNYTDFQRRDATAAGLRAKARGAGTTR